MNRAPVLTLWATVVAEVLGFEHDEALTLGRTVAGLNADSKGVSLGLFQPPLFKSLPLGIPVWFPLFAPEQTSR